MLTNSCCLSLLEKIINNYSYHIITFAATDEPRLREAFGEFGTVTDVFLPMERGTSRPRGFGFVTFANRDAAEAAISKMDQSQLDGRTIRVNESKPRGEGPGAGGGGGGRPGMGPGGVGGFNPQGRDEVKLYVGNLSFETTEDSVRQMFEKYGQVTDCFLPTDRDTGRVRGFAFVTMPAKEAEEACDKVNGLEVDGRALRVNEAQPKGMGGGGRGGGGFGRGGYGGGGYGGGVSIRFAHAFFHLQIILLIQSINFHFHSMVVVVVIMITMEEEEGGTVEV